MNGVISELQDWVESRCDGDWEHGDGVRITMLDNPGWAVDIDLRDTRWKDRSIEEFKVNRSDSDWLYLRLEGGKYTIRCGVRNLEEGLAHFLRWVK